MGLIRIHYEMRSLGRIGYDDVRGAVSSIRMIGISAIYLDYDDDDDGENDDDIARRGYDDVSNNRS